MVHFSEISFRDDFAEKAVGNEKDTENGIGGAFTAVAVFKGGMMKFPVKSF